MKSAAPCVTLLALVAIAAGSPINNFRFQTDDFSNEQSLEVLSNAVTGHYTFMTPEGIEYFVRYIADARGFRILESNALPQRQSSAAVAGVLQQRSRQALGNSRVQQRTNQGFGSNTRVQLQQQSNRQAFRAPSRQFDSRESFEQQRNRQAFRSSNRQFDSRESFELFDSDERQFF